MLGSTVSFVFNGGGLWSTLLLALKRRRLNALKADASHLVALVTFLFFPISYSTWSITAKATLARIVVLASMAACFGALILAVIQYHWLGMRAEGGAGNAIPFATVACLSVMMCLAGALSGIERVKGLPILAALAGTIAILYSGTRIIWLAELVSGIAVLLINRRRLGGAGLGRMLLIAAAISPVIVAVGYPVISERADFLFSDWYALATKGDHSTALGLRVALWQIAVGAFGEAPFIGHGIAASRALMQQGFHDQFGMTQGFSHFHNGFLTALVEAGLLGALTLAAIFVVAARNAATVLRVSTDPLERFGATMIAVTVITYLIGGLTGILLGHDILGSTFMVFMVSGTYLASGRQSGPCRRSGARPRQRPSRPVDPKAEP